MARNRPPSSMRRSYDNPRSESGEGGYAGRTNGFTVPAVSVEITGRGCSGALFATITSIDDNQRSFGRRPAAAKRLGISVSNNVSQQFDALVKKAEETLRQRAAGDRIRIQVGSATCEHAAGSNEVLDEFRKHIAASGRDDIVLHQTGCTGRCSREPIVGVMVPGQMPVKYERVDRQAGPRDLHPAHPAGQARAGPHARRPDREDSPSYEMLICGSVRCGWKGDQAVRRDPGRKAPGRRT